jgi:hypothetical protein
MRLGLRSEGGAGIFIIHHLEPVAIFEVDNEPFDALDEPFYHQNREGNTETWYIKLQYAQRVDALELAKLIKKAWHWYQSYMDFEDDDTTKQKLN